MVLWSLQADPYILKIVIYPINKQRVYITRKSISHLVNMRSLKEKGWKPVSNDAFKFTTFTDVCMAGCASLFQFFVFSFAKLTIKFSIIYDNA